MQFLARFFFQNLFTERPMNLIRLNVFWHSATVSTFHIPFLTLNYLIHFSSSNFITSPSTSICFSTLCPSGIVAWGHEMNTSLPVPLAKCANTMRLVLNFLSCVIKVPGHNFVASPFLILYNCRGKCMTRFLHFSLGTLRQTFYTFSSSFFFFVQLHARTFVCVIHGFVTWQGSCEFLEWGR